MDNSVADMISDIIGNVSVPTEKVATEKKEEKEEVKEDGDKEKGEESKEESGEPEPKSETGEEEGKEVADDKDEIINQLREQLAALSGVQEVNKDGNESNIANVDIEDVPVGDFFKSDEEYDKAFEDKKVMNEVLKRVHVKAVESTMKAIPQIIDNVVRNQVIVYSKAADFFRRNPALRQYSQFVSKVANDVSAKDPTLTLDDIFGNDEKEGKLAAETKTRLAIKDKTVKKEENKERERPAFVKGGGARIKADVKPVLQGIEREIADLL